MYRGHKQCWYLVIPPSWINDFLNPGGHAGFPQPPWHRLPELDLVGGVGPLEAMTLVRVLSNTLSWFLTVLRGILALYSSTAALLSSFLRFFLTCSFLLHWLRKCKRFTFTWTAAKQKVFVLEQWISSQTAVYNPFSVKLYFRGLSITGKKLFNFYTGQDFWQTL